MLIMEKTRPGYGSVNIARVGEAMHYSANSALDSSVTPSLSTEDTSKLDAVESISISIPNNGVCDQYTSEEEDFQSSIQHPVRHPDSVTNTAHDSVDLTSESAVGTEETETTLNSSVKNTEPSHILQPALSPSSVPSSAPIASEATKTSEESSLADQRQATSHSEQIEPSTFESSPSGSDSNATQPYPSQPNYTSVADGSQVQKRNESENNETTETSSSNQTSAPYVHSSHSSGPNISKPSMNASSTHFTQTSPTSPSSDVASNRSSSSSSSPSASTSSSRKIKNKNRINYASHDCGAKVLAANDEAVDASAVLFSSKDRYMLNPCSAPRQWIVLELCEEVGIDEIRIGNFEFFSSMIKELQILASHQYPTTSWALLGKFTLSDERELQSLDFGEESEAHPEWFKYIKIRILSHWGKEYYCPITEIQVHGLPYVEKLQRELLQSSQDLKYLETMMSLDQQPSTVPSSPASDRPPSTTPNIPPTAKSESQLSKGLRTQRDPNLDQLIKLSANSVTHQTDVVMPMHEYLEKHKNKASERINKIYDKSFPSPGDSSSSSSSFPSSSSSESSTMKVGSTSTEHMSRESEKSTKTDVSQSYDDVVHPGLPSPVPKIGGDEELDEIDEDVSAGGGGGGAMFAFRQGIGEPRLGKSATFGVQLLQVVIGRVKNIEMNISLVSGYLNSVSAIHQEEISELGEELNKLASRYTLLLNYIRNFTMNHASLDSKLNSLLEKARHTGDFQEAVSGTLRMYLLFSALLSIGICLACSFLVVFILRCLPPPERPSTHSTLERSPSELALQQLRTSPSIITFKEDPLVDSSSFDMPISAPNTPPPHLHHLPLTEDELVQEQQHRVPAATSADAVDLSSSYTASPISEFVATHSRRHSEPNHFN